MVDVKVKESIVDEIYESPSQDEEGEEIIYCILREALDRSFTC
jgi:hypothetical protein